MRGAVRVAIRRERGEEKGEEREDPFPLLFFPLKS